MSSALCMTIRFLQPCFHGRTDGGETEWPPSPLRMFQSLTAAAAARWRNPTLFESAAEALRWLERQAPPLIIAPKAAAAETKYRIYVPDNVGDKVAKSWNCGGNASVADYRTEKDIRPMRLAGEAIHYVFTVEDSEQIPIDLLRSASRSITHLGWGIDMVVGDASIRSPEEVAILAGERWQPVEDPSAVGYRMTVPGTLTNLIRKHAAFLSRIQSTEFHPVPPLTRFRIVGYRHALQPPGRPFAAFTLLNSDATAIRSFDPLRRTREVAGMMRHAVALTASEQGWSDELINEFVHGKTPDGSRPPNGTASPDRFQYLPLPALNLRQQRVESIRQVLIAAPPHCRRQVAWASRALAGAALVDHTGVQARLGILQGSHPGLRVYAGPARLWSTVTPVILPGYDDANHLRQKLKHCQTADHQKRILKQLDSRIDNLIRKAFRQAGYSQELVDALELDWRDFGFHSGVQLASRYLPPDNLNRSPRFHVRVRFPTPASGPIAVGSGRFRGFGLFSSREENLTHDD